MKEQKDIIISVVGLGYVGLPVATYMADKYKTVGFDVNENRIQELRSFKDHTLEVDPSQLNKKNLSFTSEVKDLASCNFHIIAVPTPVNDANTPDFRCLVSASESVGQILKAGDIVVYESTVFPGATEEICLPVLLKVSGLKREDFNIGYSPERINPGDKEHSFTKITKVVSADTPEALRIVSQVYASVVEAGVFEAESIKVAEAAKVIENTQRDINIALMNELTLICDKMDINVYSVIEAAKTKWNFLGFTPGLVGGHCIGVDPYYLTYKATQLGYHPEVILAGRRINDEMPKYVARKIIKSLINQSKQIKDQSINILGLTFKENCPDLRNTKVIDIVNELKSYGMIVNICDPHASKEEAYEEYGVELMDYKQLPKSDATVLAVKHKEFDQLEPDSLSSPIIFDIKGVFRGYKGSKTIIPI